MKKVVVILDYAHGKDVAGKRSPCGRHEEWRWSRERGRCIKIILQAIGFTVYETNPTDSEIGLSKRVRISENIPVEEGQIKFFISLHNNAAGDGTKWMSARGMEIWTKRGVDLADDFSDFYFKIMREWFPTVPMRLNSPINGQKDKEGNLAVLKAAGVYSVLIEHLFQDNKVDVELLLDPTQNKKFEDAVVDLVEKAEKFMNE